MEKILLKSEPQLRNVSQLKTNEQIGFTTISGDKGYLVYAGQNVIHAVSATETGYRYPNVSFGGKSNNSETVQEALDFSARGVVAKIKEVFVFETRKELYKWLAE